MFEDEAGVPLQKFDSWSVPDGLFIPKRAQLAAMKIRAFPRRDRSHKREKHLADLHAIVWYGTTFDEIRTEVQSSIGRGDITRFRNSVTEADYQSAAALAGVDVQTLRTYAITNDRRDSLYSTEFEISRYVS